MGRSFLLMAALVLMLMQGAQSYLSIQRESQQLERFGASVAESASVAMSTPLWLMSGEALADVMRSYVAHDAVDRVIVYEGEDPWLAYDREAGLVGDPGGESGAYDEIDPESLFTTPSYARLDRAIVYGEERIGSVEIAINDRRIAAARQRSLFQTIVVIIAEVLIIFAIMRMRGSLILTESLSRMNDSLRRFVPDEFLGFLHKEDISGVQLGDHTEEWMAVLFLDIRSFTKFSESLSPEENFDFINSFLGQMGPVVRGHGGFVDKYLGDGFMALFPGSIEDAVASAVDLRRELRVYNESRAADGFPPIDFGIGIHAGNLMLGTVGEQMRMDGTVMSSVVNLASRLEGLTKEFGIGIAVSQYVADTVGEGAEYMRYLGHVSVKGAREPVAVYEIFEGEDEDIRTRRASSRAAFEAGARCAVEGKYAEALSEFRRALQQCPDDPALDYYLRLLGNSSPAGPGPAL